MSSWASQRVGYGLFCNRQWVRFLIATTRLNLIPKQLGINTHKSSCWPCKSLVLAITSPSLPLTVTHMLCFPHTQHLCQVCNPARPRDQTVSCFHCRSRKTLVNPLHFQIEFFGLNSHQATLKSTSFHSHFFNQTCDFHIHLAARNSGNQFDRKHHPYQSFQSHLLRGNKQNVVILCRTDRCLLFHQC